MRVIPLLVFQLLLSTLVLSQPAEQKLKVFIENFVGKLNSADTTDLSMLFTYKEVADQVRLLYGNEKSGALVYTLLEVGKKDQTFVDLLGDYTFDCYFVRNNRVLLREKDLVQIHTSDETTLKEVHKAIKDMQHPLTESFFERYLAYREYVVSKKDTALHKELLGSQICDKQLVEYAKGVVEFFNLPANYKWIVGRLRRKHAGNKEVKILSIEYGDVTPSPSKTNLFFSEPILVLGFENESKSVIRLKLNLIYIDGTWKIYRPLEYK